MQIITLETYKRVQGKKRHRKKNLNYAVGDHQEDFKTEKESAKKWIESHKLALDQNLTSAQRESIKNLHTPGEDYDLNKVLKDTGGNIDSLPIIDNDGEQDDSSKALIEMYKTDIQHINKAFNHASGKIPGKMYVYKELDMLDFGYDVPISEIDDNELTKEFEKNYTSGLFSEYLKVKPYYQKKPDNNINIYRRILLKLSLPIGTKVIPGDNETLYLPRQNGINITKMSKQNFYNQDVLQIEANFVHENEIKNDITKLQKKMNSDWNVSLDLPDDYEIVEFRMSDKYVSGSIAHMNTAIKDVLEINPNFARDISRFIKEKNGKIIFTDQLLGYLEGIQYDNITPERIEKANTSAGITNNLNRVIGINGRIANTQVKAYDQLSRILYHEMTHLGDSKLGLEYFGRGNFSTQDKDFLELYEKDKDKLIDPFFDYAKMNPSEYFAEVHSFIYSDIKINGESLSDIVADLIPDTVLFITELFPYSVRYNKLNCRNNY
ncbi:MULTISPECIES: hypothetical protein [Bacillus cereus group]|uniref:ATLF-like domain-containing protein n=1 Tax=Bacillus thuringiensis TaxID=1428 RepID=A0A9X7FTP0_BACTU|nr:hypothetical protein [Bacillus thuringiensis]MCQ6336214.1 hypothetical protein [Bacillus cereus]PFT38511.1 hypothetical protein COK72_25845 [Bacillus thuringiensis]